MRIGIDARMYSSGFTGIGRYVFELIKYLGEIDQENEYFCFLNAPEFEKFYSPAKNISPLPVKASHYSAAEQTNFLRKLNRTKCDLVHFTHFNTPLLYRGKTVVTIHDLTLSFFPGKKMTSLAHRLAYNLVLRRSVKHAKKIIAVSENTKNDLTQLLKTPEEKIQVVYNGVGKEFQPAKDIKVIKKYLADQYKITENYLLYTGVWRDHKNLVGLIEALEKLINEKKFSGVLVITGKENPVYAPEIYKAIEESSLKNKVIFTGLVSDEDLVKLYQAAKVFVFPSFYEGFGLPPLEAMACGIPVATSETSSMPEVCGDKNALFFDPRNIEDMTEKIWEAWSDEGLRKKLSDRGVRRASEFSWKKMAEETLDVYKKTF